MISLQDEVCKLLLWMSLSFSAAVNLFTVALALDRVIAVLFPFWHRELNKLRAARRTALCVTAVILAIPISEVPARQFDHVTSTCSFKEGHPAAAILAFLVVIMFVFPLGTLILSNIIFVWALKKRTSRQPNRNPSSNNVERENQRRKNEMNYIVMMLVTTCCFIVLQVASRALFFESSRRELSGLDDASSHFFASIGRLLLIANSSFNIFFYSTTSMFRKAFKEKLSKFWN